MNSKKTEGWVLCPSKSFAGKYYYFNVTTGEAAWSLNEDERKLLRTSLVQKDKHSYPEPSGPPVEDIPSVFAQDTNKNEKSLDTDIFVGVQTYQKPVFGQSVFMIPDIQSKGPLIVQPDSQISTPPTFASLSRLCLPSKDERMNYAKNLTEIDRDLFIPTSFTPLCQRFVNFEEPNAERSRKFVRCSSTDEQLGQRLAEPRNKEPDYKDEQLTHQFANKNPHEVEQLTHGFTTKRPLKKFEQQTYRIINEPLYYVEQPTSRFSNDEPLHEFEHSTSRYVNQEPLNKVEPLTFVNKTSLDHHDPIVHEYVTKDPLDEEQFTHTFIVEEPHNTFEQPTSKFVSEELYKNEQFKHRFVTKEPLKKVELVTQNPVDVEQLTNRFVHKECQTLKAIKTNQQILFNKGSLKEVEQLTQRIDKEPFALKEHLQHNPTTKVIKMINNSSPKFKYDTSTPIKILTPLFPHEKSSIGIKQFKEQTINEPKPVMRKPVFNIVQKAWKVTDAEPGDSLRLGVSNLKIINQCIPENVFYKDSDTPKPPAKESHTFQSSVEFRDVEKSTLSQNESNPDYKTDKEIFQKYYICHTEPCKEKSTISHQKQIDFATNEESELLKDLKVNDLRRILMANRKRKMADVNNVNPDEVKKICLRKEETRKSPTPKKKVAFNLVPEQISDSTSNDSTHYTDDYTATEDKEEFKLLPSSKSNPWYLVVDTQVLLDELKYLENFTKQDPKCHIFIPSHVMSDVIRLTKSDSAVGSRVTSARHLMRRLWKPHPQIIAPISTDDVAELSIEDAILKSCLVAMQEDSFVVLVTNDENLLSKAKNHKIHCLNVEQIKDGDFEKPEVSFDIKKIVISVPNTDLSYGIPIHAYKKKLFEREKENNNNSNSENKNIGTKSIPETHEPDNNIKKQNSDPFDIQKSPTERPTDKNNDKKFNSNKNNKQSPQNDKNETVERSEPEKEIVSTYFQNKDRDMNQTLASLFKRAKENALRKRKESLATDETVRNTSKKSIELDGIEKVDINTQVQSNFEKDKDISKFERFENLKVQFKNSQINKDQSEKVLSMTRLCRVASHRDKNFPGSWKCENPNFPVDNSIFDDLPTKDTPMMPDNYKYQSKPFISTHENQKPTNSLSKPSVFVKKPPIFASQCPKTKENQHEPIIFGLEKPTNQLQPSVFTDEKQKTVDRTKEEELLIGILEKNNITENRIENRKEEIMCSMKQILEECLTDILKNSSIQKSPLPWSLAEAIQYTNKVYGAHTTIKSALNMMASVFDARGEVKRSVLDVSGGIKARVVVNFVGSGFLLLDCLKKILPNFEVLNEAENSLNEILQNEPKSIMEQDDTPAVSHAVTHHETLRRANFVKNRSEVINYLTKHYPAWAGFDATQKSNENVTVVRTSGKNLNLLDLNKSKIMTLKLDDSKINGDNTETNKIDTCNTIFTGIETYDDKTGMKNVKETQVRTGKAPEHNTTNATKTFKSIDKVIPKNVNEKLAELQLIKEVNTKCCSKNREKCDFIKDVPKTSRTLEKIKLNRRTAKIDDNTQNVEGSKSSSDTQDKSDHRKPIYNFKITKHAKSTPKLDENTQNPKEKETIIGKHTQMISDYKKTDIKTTRSFDKKSTKDDKINLINRNNTIKTHVSDSQSTSQGPKTDLEKAGPKVIRPFNKCLNNKKEIIKKHDDEKQKPQNMTANEIDQKDFQNPEMVLSRNFEFTKTLYRGTISNLQTTTGNKDKSEEMPKEKDTEKTELKTTRLSYNLNQQVKDATEFKNKTDFDLDFPVKGHTFGTNEITGPKVIRNVKLLQEYEDKIKYKRLDTDLDASDCDWSENDSDLSHHILANENSSVTNNIGSSINLNLCAASNDATNDAIFLKQNRDSQNGVNNSASDRNNFKPDATNDSGTSQSRNHQVRNDAENDRIESNNNVVATNDSKTFTQSRNHQVLNDAKNDKNQYEGKNIDVTNDSNTFTRSRDHEVINDSGNNRIQHSKSNAKIDAPNDLRNFDTRKTTEPRNFDVHSLFRMYRDNKDDAINDFASFVSCQTNNTTVNDFESCLTNVSIASFIRGVNPNENNSDAINDGRKIDNSKQEVFFFIMNFLKKIFNVLKLAEDFVQSCKADVRSEQKMKDKIKIYAKAKVVQRVVTKMIDSFKSIILRECCLDTSLGVALATVANDDVMRNYRLVVSHFLSYAQNHLRELNIVLSECGDVAYLDNGSCISITDIIDSVSD